MHVLTSRVWLLHMVVDRVLSRVLVGKVMSLTQAILF